MLLDKVRNKTKIFDRFCCRLPSSWDPSAKSLKSVFRKLGQRALLWACSFKIILCIYKFAISKVLLMQWVIQIRSDSLQGRYFFFPFYRWADYFRRIKSVGTVCTAPHRPWLEIDSSPPPHPHAQSPVKKGRVGQIMMTAVSRCQGIFQVTQSGAFTFLLAEKAAQEIIGRVMGLLSLET